MQPAKRLPAIVSALALPFAVGFPETSQSQTTGPECGQPAFGDPGVYLWRDCAAGGSAARWFMRAFGGGLQAFRYQGVLNADTLLSATGISLEANDVVDSQPADRRIDFSLSVVGTGFDGFRTDIPGGAATCFAVQAMPATAGVYVGAGRIPMTGEFNLESLGPCGTTVTSGPNFLVILTDDQRWDTTWAMPQLQSKLNSRGVVFENAFVSSPLCCPSRASLLAGGFYAHNTGVNQNSGDNGAESAFRGQDRDTIATALQALGYKTMFAGGKYLNGYKSPYIPPGWNQFVNNNLGPDAGQWFSYKVTVGSSNQLPGQGQVVQVTNKYVTDYHRDQVLAFLDSLQPSEKFLAFFAPFAPHGPAIPAAQDANLYPGYVYRERGFGETDLSDKPDWVRNPNRALSAKTSGQPDDDEFHRDQLRSLASVDRAIGAFIDRLVMLGRLDDTVIIFASDNGFLWGEHGLHQKGMAYEESVRVPFTIYVPGVTPRTDDSLVVANLDIGATIFDMADADKATEGLSLLPLLQNPSAPWRSHVLLQNWGSQEGANGTWSAIRTETSKFIENAIGEIELYDLLIDEFELNSQHQNPSYATMRDALANQLAQERGLAVRTFTARSGQVGVPYSLQLTAWGGRQPYSWTLQSGTLPPGLALNTQTGRISGTPTTAGSRTFKILLRDSSVRPRLGGPQSYVAPGWERNTYTITINP
jgi:arylsulfatase A-like enzyme